MTTSQTCIDRRDIQFILFEHLGVQRVLGTAPYVDLTEEDLQMVLEAAVELASEVIAPTNAAGDREGCRWDDGEVTVPAGFEAAWQAIGEQGWIGLVAEAEAGGQGLPLVLGTAVDEMVIGANPALHTFLGLSRAASHLLLRHAGPELCRVWVPPILEGRWQATMCLTEAGAGTDVGASVTRATPVGDGTYRIEGTKVFITCGQHQLSGNHVHLVLARLPDGPAGVKGLSLFLVPRFRLDEAGQPGASNDVICSKIEEKMGIHGSPTCVLNFGEAGDCIGYLVGGEHDGIRCMFDMMTEERIVVGLQGQAAAGVMYGHALRYARERIQGSDIREGKSITESKVPILEHPDVRRLLLTVRALAEGGRALLYSTALHQDLARTAADEERRSWHLGRFALLTPICKAWGSDTGFEACSLALQVFGGSGYISDFPAEQYLRDSRIAAIYEGTNGIQALDLLFRKVIGRQGGVCDSFVADLKDWTGQGGRRPGLEVEVGALGLAIDDLVAVTDHLRRMAADDIALAALGATPYLALFGNVVVGHLLLEQAVIALDRLAEDPGQDFYRRKLATARFFVHQILSQNAWRKAQIMSEDRAALDGSL